MVIIGKKPFCRAIINTYVDFAENTSIHGLKYTVKKDTNTYEKFQEVSRFAKARLSISSFSLENNHFTAWVYNILLWGIAWVLIVSLGITGSVFMVGLFWQRFTSNPTRTSVGTTYAPTTVIPFPAITICNINRILTTKVNDFVRKLNLHGFDEDYIRKIVPQLLAFTDPSDYNITSLNMLHDLFDINDFTTIRRVMRSISQSCRDMLVKCKWESKIVDCRKYFIDTLTTNGFCCSFNYHLRNRAENTTLFFGIEMGLTVLLNPMLEETQHSGLYSRGMQVLIHHPHNYPGFGNTEKILAVGRETLLQIDGTRYICSKEVRQLTPEQRKCVYSDEYKLNYFNDYTQPNCITECLANYINSRCECLPYFYTFSDKEVCNVTKIPCLVETRNNRNEISQRRDCDCPMQCEDIFYNVLSTSTKFFKTEYLTSSFLYDANTTENSMLLHVYFRSQTQTILLRDTLTSTIYLLSSFGGIFSLFLGCSFISGAEIIYYICIRFFINFNSFNKIENQYQDKLHQRNFNKKNILRSTHIGHGNFKHDGVYAIYGRDIFLN